MPINVSIIEEMIRAQLTAAVNDVAQNAHDLALKNVPVRKVFRYGRTPRTNVRIQGRQETRTLSVDEAQAEAGIRRKLGLSSAFSQTAAGRRRGSQPVVQTALFPGNYRSRDRANDYRSLGRRTSAQIGGVNRLVTIQQTEVLSSTQRKVFVSVPVISPEAESDLSARGRYELKRRKKNSAITGRGDERTLGGALRKTVQNGLTLATPEGRRIKATIEAGSEEVTYAKYVEFGTRHARAQPFLRPALAQAREELMASVINHLKGTV